MKNRERLLQKLAALPQRARAAIKPAVEQGAAEIIAMQKSLVPKETGALERSIQAVRGDVNRRVGLSTGDVKGDPDLTVAIVAGDETAYYARWVEFGTAPHINGGKFKGSQNPGMRAQPFFYGPVRALRRRVKSRITRATRKAAREVASS
ncbi:HK97-gp10 family putative phage morphogenesis protein [Microvirga sp. TS319]|uniref:HK97-gp10 family putative phage morphogenesis protein n=1 Tax=Microvirga sp. TS319 TaxID=3241165 RepID=UPI00351A9E49